MGDTVLEARVKSLAAKKAAIEEEIDEQLLVLKSQGVGMSDPLVDSAGFPRADVDVFTVRHTRSTIIRLRNDARALEEEIAKALMDLHEARRKASNPIPKAATGSAGAGSVGGASQEAQQRVPESLATITGVAPGSPADEAELKRDDVILSIGSITPANASSLPSFVKAHENVPVKFRVRRDGQGEIVCEVTPRASVAGQWKGLLGIAMNMTK